MVERAALILSWVDIETEWNLKRAWKTNGVRNADVDIETEWNLKFRYTPTPLAPLSVDIETEWNLKPVSPPCRTRCQSRYRNRVEFKERLENSQGKGKVQ